MDKSMVGSGTDISQSISKGKIALETMDQTNSPSQRTTKRQLEKKVKKLPLVDAMKVKESPLAGALAPPQSVEGEDWIVLQLRPSPMKKLFK